MARDDGLGFTQAAQFQGQGMNTAMTALQAGLQSLIAQQQLRRQQDIAAKQRAEDIAMAQARDAEARRQFGVNHELQQRQLTESAMASAAARARDIEGKDLQASQQGQRFITDRVPLGDFFPRREVAGPTMTQAPSALPRTPVIPSLPSVASQYARSLPAPPDLRMLVPKGPGAARRLERDPNYVDPEEAKRRFEQQKERAAKRASSYSEMSAELYRMAGAADDKTGDLERILLQSDALAQRGDADAAASTASSAVRDEAVRAKFGYAIANLMSRFQSNAHDWDPDAVSAYQSYLMSLAKKLNVAVPGMETTAPPAGGAPPTGYEGMDDAELEAKIKAAKGGAAAGPPVKYSPVPGGLSLPPQPGEAPSAGPERGAQSNLVPVDIGGRRYVLEPTTAAGVTRVLSLLTDPEDRAAFANMITSGTRGETNDAHAKIMALQNAPPYRSQQQLREARARGEQQYPVAGPGQSDHVQGAALDIDPGIYQRAAAGDVSALRILAALRDAGWHRPWPETDAPHWRQQRQK